MRSIGRLITKMAEPQDNVAWLENDTLFKGELARGHEWQLYVGELLMREGFYVNVPQKRVRANVRDRHRWRNTTDLWVGSRTNMARLEVKSESTYWTGPHDHPYNPSMIMTLKSWYGLKKPLPLAVVVVSQQSRAIKVMSTKIADRWTVKEMHDKTRNITDEWYIADRSLWITWERFVKILKQKLYPELLDPDYLGD